MSFEIGSEEGTMIFEWTFGGVWPPQVVLPIFQGPANGVTISVVAQIDGSILFEIITQDTTLTVRSLPILLPSPPIVRFGIAWHLPDDVRICANGTFIDDSGISNPIQLTNPEALEVPDFSEVNRSMQAKRTEWARQITPRNGRRLRTLEEEVDFLEQAAQQLFDLNQLAIGGKDYHARGFASQIRALVARNFAPLRYTSIQMQPLLQRVAGKLDLPLIVCPRIFIRQ